MHAQSSQRSSLRLFSILLMVGAVVGMVGNSLHPHTADPDGAATVQAIAQNGAWVAIHLAIIVAILLAAGGFLGLLQLLESGLAGAFARLGVVAALVGAAVVAVSTAIDGFVMKALALAWAGMPAAQAPGALQFAVGVKDTDFGIWSIGMLIFFGFAFVSLGAAVIVGRRLPAWFGWVAVVSGLGSATAALIQIANSGEVQAAETIFLGSSVLGTVWIFLLGVLLWRVAPAPAAAKASLETP